MTPLPDGRGPTAGEEQVANGLAPGEPSHVQAALAAYF